MIDLGHTLHVYIWLISKNLKMLIDKKIKRKNRKKRKIKYFLSKIEYKYSKIFFFFRKKKLNRLFFLNSIQIFWMIGTLKIIEENILIFIVIK